MNWYFWVRIVSYSAILVFSALGQNIKEEEKSRMFFTMAINLLAVGSFFDFMMLFKMVQE